MIYFLLRKVISLIFETSKNLLWQKMNDLKINQTKKTKPKR